MFDKVSDKNGEKRENAVKHIFICDNYHEVCFLL